MWNGRSHNRSFRLCSHGDSSPLPLLPGSDGISRRKLDSRSLEAVDNGSARHDSWRNCLGPERTYRWYSIHSLDGRPSFLRHGRSVDAAFENS
jgi:hypothetical protein